MKTTLRTGTTGLVLALAAAAPASAATVTVRVEGASSTLVRQVQVTPSDAVSVDKTATGGTTCEGNTYGGALELATGGDWTGPAFEGLGQSVSTIKGENHVFGSGAYWAFDVNNTPASFGLCDPANRPAQGDEILLYAACEAPAPSCFSEDPLDVTAPATVAPGAAFSVRVDEYTSPFGQTPTKAPSARATVTAGGVAATTGPDGTASLSSTQRGPIDVVATKGGRVRDSAGVCVTDGSDGFCGTTVPDRRAPQARITGIKEQQVFRRGRGPRRLTAVVGEDPSGLSAVRLGLSRARDGRCFVLSGRTSAFRRARCGSHPRFRVGDRPRVSYLLPRRLGPGRYVLDVIAIDKASNRDRLARGRNRIVFTVR